MQINFSDLTNVSVHCSAMKMYQECCCHELILTMLCNQCLVYPRNSVSIGVVLTVHFPRENKN